MALAAAALLVAGAAGIAFAAGSSPARPAALSGSGRPTAVAVTSTSTSTTVAPTATTTTRVATTTSTIPRRSRAAQPASAATSLALAGCPVAPHPPVSSPPPWHPAVLVPDSQLPPPEATAPWTSHLAPLNGTGMWIWEWSSTDGGDARAVVRRAAAAHLHQLWVRVGDSKDGFYGAAELAQLVPAAHAAGLSVMAWGFPYLYDPVSDARWTAQILAWRGPGGATVDGYSADIERPSEGVALSARRVALYLSEVRRAAGGRLLVATVYPPLDPYWYGDYPFHAMAPYVDAFAPMVYWECADPRAEAIQAVARLSSLRPVHVIGQAFDMAAEGGRPVAPSGQEITAFLAAARRAGALGGSFWVWQHATPGEWAAVSAFRW